MNFLAHVYLSYGQAGLLVGNMIGDFVKGNQYLQYEECIQKGIQLHRQIDSFTDSHPIIQETKQIYRQSVGRYDGAFLDISFDYCLANASTILSPSAWREKITQAYTTIDKKIETLPPAFAKMFSYMENGDWLYNYRYTWQIKKSFEGLAKRAKYLENDVNPFADFEKNITYMEQSFSEFFPQLEAFVLDWIDKNHITLQ